LTVSQDTDVPYENVIGFLIPIADIKLLIKNAIGGGSSEAPAETPAPEAPAETSSTPEEPVSENENKGEQKYTYATSQPYKDSYNIIFKAYPSPKGTKTKKEIEDIVKQWNNHPNKKIHPPSELKFFRSMKQAKEYNPMNEIKRMQELAFGK